MTTGMVLPVLCPQHMQCRPRSNRMCHHVSYRGVLVQRAPQTSCNGRAQLQVHAALGGGAKDMTIETPPEWQSPNRPEGPPSSPPEYTPPREPGQVPGSVPEYEPPETPGPSPPSPADPPLRPLPPDQDPQIPDPERDDPLRNPEKRRQETNDPPPVQPGRVLPPEDSIAGPRAGPAAAAGSGGNAEPPGPSKASDRQLPVDPAMTSAQRPVPPPSAEVNVQFKSGE